MTRHPDDLAFPRQLARTRSFLNGRPRDAIVAPDGRRVVFLRSPRPDDPANGLWVLDVATGVERLVAGGAEGGSLTAAERARRERARERAGGIVRFATDVACSHAVFVLRGRLHIADLGGSGSREIPTPGVPDDPRLSPDGRRVAYVVDGDLHVQDVPDGEARVLAVDPDPAVSWGLADFAAAEEMDRMRGYWWSPDGTWIAAARVDENPVETWYLADPTDPASAPRAVRYPRAGTPNAVVTLHLLEVAGDRRVAIRWDEPERFEYLARVEWKADAPPTLLVQSRDQRETRLLEVDVTTGATRVVRRDAAEPWVELVAGAPTRRADGSIVSTVDDADTRRLAIDGAPATPPGLHVRSVLDVEGDDVWFTADEDPFEEHVYRLGRDGSVHRVSAEPGLHRAAVGGGTVALRSWRADTTGVGVTVLRGGEAVATLADHGELPCLEPRPRYLVLGERELRSVLLLPDGREPDAPLPVLLSPYAMPHALQATRWPGGLVEEQWFADRLGAAVLVIDGRGTPGRGLAWERAVAADLSLPLEDQVDGLAAAAAAFPFLDTSRVAMRGWSGGGMLSALAVILRPDVFHAAVAGAPNADSHLYDTHYTERYLGMPAERPEAYDRSSPVFHARERGLTRPLLIMHGLADDNVFVAHSLALSAALFARGCPHRLAIIPGASHMGGSDDVIVGRYLAELDFLREVLLPAAR